MACFTHIRSEYEPQLYGHLLTGLLHSQNLFQAPQLLEKHIREMPILARHGINLQQPYTSCSCHSPRQPFFHCTFSSVVIAVPYCLRDTNLTQVALILHLQVVVWPLMVKNRHKLLLLQVERKTIAPLLQDFYDIFPLSLIKIPPSCDTRLGRLYSSHCGSCKVANTYCCL